ncbi:imidazolonepropionase [Chitinophagales bacterium]|nr:imidazolonepropionase [Chitinophagales bacterium]
MSLLIKNIGQLAQIRETAPKWVAGKEMANLPSLSNAFLSVNERSDDSECISSWGEMVNCPTSADTVIDAKGGIVLPSWCDSHTHIVYATSREAEFVDRIKGRSYEEIAENGGGILNSARKLEVCSEDDLFESAKARLFEVIGYGTGAIEIKSGYGLTVDAEIKMLRVIKRLKAISPIPIKANFLGAHAIPLLYKERRSEYIDLLINEMLPIIIEENLADYIDVFCDRGFYTVEETDRILKAGAAVGLRAKIHANELDYSGGVQVGVKNNALSVDHLECVGQEEIDALLFSETMPTILPSTAFFLGLEYAPARKMIDAGLPVALATDYNPGSTPSGRFPFVLSLACLKMDMLPEEAINAMTINSAYAMDLGAEHGSITKGKIANLIITKPVSSLAFLPYAFGTDWIDRVILNGKVVETRHALSARSAPITQ